jgi:hypothetical protein
MSDRFLQGTGTGNSSILDNLADLFLTGLAAQERITLLEEQFLGMIRGNRFCDERQTVYLLHLLERAYQHLAVAEGAGPWGSRTFVDRAAAITLERLRALYRQIPTGTRDESCHEAFGGSVTKPFFPETKKRLFSIAMEQWWQELTPQNIEVFRFLISAIGPVVARPYKGYASDDEKWSAEHGLPAKEVQDSVIDAIRERLTNRVIRINEIEGWLEQPCVPTGLLKLLALAWAKAALDNGIFFRNLNFAKVLDPSHTFELTERSIALVQHPQGIKELVESTLFAKTGLNHTLTVELQPDLENVKVCKGPDSLDSISRRFFRRFFVVTLLTSRQTLRVAS